MSKTDGTPEQPTITFHYLKTAQFRSIHVDGIIGGVTPPGLVHFAVFGERPAIPTATTHELTPTKGGEGEFRLGPVVSEESRGGVVREMEADLVMTPLVARQMRDWLTAKLKTLEVGE